MALVIQKTKDRYNNWPVDVKVPGDGGVYSTHRISVTFRKISETELGKMIEERKPDRDVAEYALLGWSDIRDDEGNELVYEDELTRAAVLDSPGFSHSVARAFIEVTTSGRTKN